MGKTKKVGPTGGLRARYGATVRKRYREVLTETKKSHRCPQCNTRAVKRRSVGVWECGKCDFTFAGGAYTPSTKLGQTARRAAKGETTQQ
ncbi:MAG: 50S ribosomal protein L37ae [Candidatus Bathyarchaeota archaeon]|nr:MAG: 50S ribosomal protein L37ae [Candidatus Bathyarchaeota archaeon]